MDDKIKNSLPYTIVFSFIVTFVFVLVLALANESTLDQVKINKRIADNASILSALQIPVSKGYTAAIDQEITDKIAQYQIQTFFFKEVKDAGKVVTGYTKLSPEEGLKLKAAGDPALAIVYTAVVDGKKIWAKPFVGFGLWGSIPGVIAFNEDLTRTAGLEIYPGRHQETPGLGGRIEEDWFKHQMVGEALVNGKIIVFKAGEGAQPDKANKDDGIVDGITGATLTSKGMEKAYADEYIAMKKLLEVLNNGQ